MVPIMVKSDDVRRGRKAKVRHGRLRAAQADWVKMNENYGQCRPSKIRKKHKVRKENIQRTCPLSFP